MIKQFSVQGESHADVFFANATVADDTKFPMYWARPLVGTVRQVAVVKWSDGHTSFIDNTCGQALVKFQEGWWPNRAHRGLTVVETVEQLESKQLPESEWNQYDFPAAVAESKRLEELENEFFKDNPEHERIKALKAMINKSKADRFKDIAVIGHVGHGGDGLQAMREFIDPKNDRGIIIIDDKEPKDLKQQPEPKPILPVRQVQQSGKESRRQRRAAKRKKS
jgi:hypothetical protein